MSKAKERALEVYPRSEKYTSSQRLIINDLRDGFIQGYEQAEKDLADASQFSSRLDGFFYGKGYEQAEKDILTIIESRISEIIGDAQPKPALRAELEELITRIKNED